MNAYKEFWTKLINMEGTTSRFDFWLTMLFNAVLLLFVFRVTGVIERLLGNDSIHQSVLSSLLIVLTIVIVGIGTVAMMARRLQDIGIHSKWIMVFILNPFLLIFADMLPGQTGYILTFFVAIVFLSFILMMFWPSRMFGHKLNT